MSTAPNTVTVHLAGGLGNQLFQYAFGRRLALTNKATLYLDATGYQVGGVPDYATGVRVCELTNFAISGIVVEGREPGADEVRPPRTWASRKLVKWWGKLVRLMGQITPYYLRREIVEPEENHFRFDRRVYDRSCPRRDLRAGLLADREVLR